MASIYDAGRGMLPVDPNSLEGQIVPGVEPLLGVGQKRKLFNLGAFGMSLPTDVPPEPASLPFRPNAAYQAGNFLQAAVAAFGRGTQAEREQTDIDEDRAIRREALEGERRGRDAYLELQKEEMRRRATGSAYRNTVAMNVGGMMSPEEFRKMLEINLNVETGNLDPSAAVEVISAYRKAGQYEALPDDYKGLYALRAAEVGPEAAFTEVNKTFAADQDASRESRKTQTAYTKALTDQLKQTVKYGEIEKARGLFDTLSTHRARVMNDISQTIASFGVMDARFQQLAAQGNLFGLDNLAGIQQIVDTSPNKQLKKAYDRVLTQLDSIDEMDAQIEAMGKVLFPGMTGAKSVITGTDPSAYAETVSVTASRPLTPDPNAKPAAPTESYVTPGSFKSVWRDFSSLVAEDRKAPGQSFSAGVALGDRMLAGAAAIPAALKSAAGFVKSAFGADDNSKIGNANQLVTDSLTKPAAMKHLVGQLSDLYNPDTDPPTPLHISLKPGEAPKGWGYMTTEERLSVLTSIRATSDDAEFASFLMLNHLGGDLWQRWLQTKSAGK